MAPPSRHPTSLPRRPLTNRNLFVRQSKPLLQAPADALVLATCAWMVITGNGAFWRALLVGRSATEPYTWGLLAAVAVVLIAFHFAIVAPLANRWTVRPLLSLLILIAAFAGYYTERFTVYLDPSMLRNVLRTNVGEARELFGRGAAGAGGRELVVGEVRDRAAVGVVEAEPLRAARVVERDARDHCRNRRD